MTSTAFQLAKLMADLYEVTNQVCVHQHLANKVVVSAAHYWYGSTERNPDILQVTILPDSNLEQQDDYITLYEAIDFSIKQIRGKERIEALRKKHCRNYLMRRKRC